MNAVELFSSTRDRGSTPPHDLREVGNRTIVGVLAFAKQPERKIFEGLALDEMSEKGQAQCGMIRSALRTINAKQVTGYSSTSRRANDALRLILTDRPQAQFKTNPSLEPLVKRADTLEFELARKLQIDQITGLIKQHIKDARRLSAATRMLCVHITHSHIVEKLLASLILGDGQSTAEDLIGDNLAPGTLWQLQIFKGGNDLLEVEVSLGGRTLRARPNLLPSLLS